MPDDPYSVLGVEPGADMAQLRRAYLAQLRRNHPDLRPGDDAAEQRTRELNQAWDQIRRRAATPGAGRLAGTNGHPGAHAAYQRRQEQRRHGPYSRDQRDFRAAFTNASLRIALAVIAVGFILLAVLGR